jgi:hypothetical protein
MPKLTLQKWVGTREAALKKSISRSAKTHSTNVVMKLGAQSIAHEGGGMGPCKLVLGGRRRRTPKFCA